MNRLFHAFLITVVALCSCSPKIVTSLSSDLPPISDGTEITVPNDDAETESDHSYYAMLYLYRPSGTGGLVKYNVSLNDREIFTARSNSSTEHKVFVPGSYELKARTGTEVTNRINVRLGEDYYIRCSFGTGNQAGSPRFELMPSAQGQEEYNRISGNAATGQESHEISHWRISAGIGYGHRVGRISESDANARDYIKSLKNGLSYNFDACYYFSESLGAGLKHSVYSDSESVPGTVTYNDGTMESGTLSDNIRISFTGPIMSLRSISADAKHTLVCNYGLGYSAYNDKVKMASNAFVVKGHNLGQFLELVYGVALNKHLSASLQMSLTSGLMTSVDITYGDNTTHQKLEKENYESLSSISAGLLLSWSF